MSGLTRTYTLMTALLVGAAAAAAGPAMAQSVDYGGSNGRVRYDHYRDRGGHHDHHRHHGHKRDHDRDWYGGRERNTVIPREGFAGPSPNGGAYAGNVSGYDDEGNGTYFYIEGDGRAAGENASRPAPSARIIRPGAGSAACSNEAGVCVIRPRS